MVTRHDVDFANRQGLVTLALGHALEQTVEQTFNAVGFVTQVKDALSHDTFFVPDNVHRLEKVKDHNNVVKAEYVLDDSGAALQVKDGLAEATDFTLDALGRRFITTDANGNSVQAILDADGFQKAIIDGAGQVTKNVFDKRGLNTFTIDALGGITRKDYDSAGNLIALTDPVGNKTIWLYDEKYNTIKETDALGNGRTWTHDDLGRVETYTDKLGRFKAFTYYDVGLLHTETWKTSPTGSTVNVITWTYNENHQPLTVNDNSGTIEWTYDLLGRMETKEDVWSLVLTWGYDDANRVETVTDSFGGVMTLGWDNTNRVESRSFDDGTNELRVEYDYNNRDQVEEVRRYDDAAGTTLVSKTLYGFDVGRRLESIHHKDDSNATVNHIQYQFDTADRVTQETSTLGTTRNYSYDVTNQLLDDGSDAFSYDLNGNRAMVGYVTGLNNRIESDGTWDYFHDDENNIIGKENTGTGEIWIYAFDHNNRLTQAERKPTISDPVDLRVGFGYDALGNRILRSYDADGDGIDPAVVKKYAFDVYGNPWADLTAGGSLTTRRFFEDALDTVFARMANSGDEDWLLTDYQGSIRDILDYTGSPINHIDYESFGAIASQSSPSDSERFGYAGFEHEPELGIGLNLNRWYTFEIGRWMSNDPIGFSGGDGNLSRYVGNNPINAIDPTGLLEWIVGEPVAGRTGYRHFYVVRELFGWNRPSTLRWVGHLNMSSGTVERGNRAANRATIEAVGYQQSWDAWFHGNGWELRMEPLGPRPAGGILLDEDHARRADQAHGMVAGLAFTVVATGLSGPVANIATRAVGAAAQRMVAAAVVRAENAFVRGTFQQGSMAVARTAATRNQAILPGLFRYTPGQPIAGYQQHHLWPQAMGGPRQGWIVYAKDHVSRIHGPLNEFLTNRLDMGIRAIEERARSNPNWILPHLRDFYREQGIPFPY